jgi:hypothetical protein
LLLLLLQCHGSTAYPAKRTHPLLLLLLLLLL